MANPTLIELDIGTFKGFAESGLEFTADIISPYHTEYRPKIGEFIIVTLAPESAILGRITRFFPMGVLSSWEGDEYLAEMRRRSREVPEDLKETKLRYTVNVKLLGGLEIREGKVVYRASIRQLPHLGARVGTLSKEALQFVCSLGKGEGHSIPIGHCALGDSVFTGSDSNSELPVLFDLDHLIARRTYVFARAGYGKSNLIKLLTARLYELEQPGGMLIFDPEGEYAFRDKRGRPGLADIPFLADKLVVYTNRNVGTPYNRWVAGDVRINLAHLHPSEVVNQCVAGSKQEMVFANVIRGLTSDRWDELVELIRASGYGADDQKIIDITRNNNPAVVGAIVNNITPVVGALHARESNLIRDLRGHLAKGRIVVVDISLLSTTNGYRVAGLLLDELFRRNQEYFIAGSEGDVIPIIAVLEEAQSILGKGVSDASPFVAWVKEGRKYQLGAILVTQQPGSIAPELLSQGDNFFAFHLLSVGDLKSLQGHNAHFSNDVLASILNEPIKGNAYMWSAPDQPFVLPARIHNFEVWADSFPRQEDTGQVPVETAAEVVKREGPRKRDRIDEILGEAIHKTQNIALYSVEEIDGSSAEDLVAINAWNLQFQVGDVLRREDDLKTEYCHTLGNGKVYCEEAACTESLRRLGLFVAKATDDDERKYFVVNGRDLSRPAKDHKLKLRKAGY
jgi:hypothetical protein